MSGLWTGKGESRESQGWGGKGQRLRSRGGILGRRRRPGAPPQRGSVLSWRSAQFWGQTARERDSCQTDWETPDKKGTVRRKWQLHKWLGKGELEGRPAWWSVGLWGGTGELAAGLCAPIPGQPRALGVCCPCVTAPTGWWRCDRLRG